jgi:O-antigen/teichoic acid export membrane protein
MLNLLGPAANAVFYMAWASSMIFRVIPNATFNSLFAEGSNDEASMSAHIRKAMWMTAALLLPASALMIAGADYFLLIIGKRYAEGGSDALRLLVLANIPWSINYLAISIARVRKNSQTVFLVSVALFAVVIASFFVFVPMWGIIGGAFAYLFGQSVVALGVAIIFSMRRWLF